MDVIKVDVYKITQYKQGCVYKTKKIKTIWINLQTDDEQRKKIAQFHGGDMLAPTIHYKFGVEIIDPMGQENDP